MYKISTNELYHHGVKGMKWGVRRYQYADGTLTPAGRKRYNSANSSSISTNIKYIVDSTRTRITGRQYVDDYIQSGTTLSRIQTQENFEKYAFYATYKTHDVNEYMGLFGTNLMRRAEAEARRAEKLVKKNANKSDITNAEELRSKADNLKVYQLKIEATKKLRVPSDDNASDITARLLKKDSKFKSDVEASILDSKSKMRRPAQQLLFNQALNALGKDPGKITSSEKKAIYKAFNLSLVNHNPQEIAAQNRFYSELKKKGYNALLDYNDKDYSSYHAKRPMIVFDMDSVKLQSVTETNPKVVNTLYKLYNTERVLKEIPSNTIDLLGQYSMVSVSKCNAYVKRKSDEYLNT